MEIKVFIWLGKDGEYHLTPQPPVDGDAVDWNVIPQEIVIQAKAERGE